MIKHRGLWKKVIIGGIVGSVMVSGTALAAVKAYDKYVKVRFANIKLIVDGKTIQTKAEPFIYGSAVYAPVATIANGMGIGQRWDNNIPAVIITKPKAAAPVDTLKQRDNRIASLGYRDYQGQSVDMQNIFLDIYLHTTMYDKFDQDAQASIPAVLSQGLINTANGKGIALPTLAPDGKKIDYRDFIKGSARGYGDSGTFAFNEASEDHKGYISYYSLRDDKLTRIDSVEITKKAGEQYSTIQGNVILHNNKDNKVVRMQSIVFNPNTNKVTLEDIPLAIGGIATTTTSDTVKTK